MANQQDDLVIDTYGDNEVTEYSNTKVPTFLKFVYVILPIWGIWWWYAYWDGSDGWLDRGYWKELQTQSRTKRSRKDSDLKPKTVFEQIYRIVDRSN